MLVLGASVRKTVRGWAVCSNLRSLTFAFPPCARVRACVCPCTRSPLYAIASARVCPCGSASGCARSDPGLARPGQQTGSRVRHPRGLVSFVPCPGVERFGERGSQLAATSIVILRSSFCQSRAWILLGRNITGDWASEVALWRPFSRNLCFKPLSRVWDTWRAICFRCLGRRTGFRSL